MRITVAAADLEPGDRYWKTTCRQYVTVVRVCTEDTLLGERVVVATDRGNYSYEPDHHIVAIRAAS